MKKLFTFTCTTFVLLALPQTSFSQNVYIPDPTFKSMLLMDGSINTNMDGNIQVSEAIACSTSLYMGEYGIYDLTGIEAFINITGLDVGSNNLSSLDLSANTQLQSLACYSNNLTSLDLSANTLLYQVDAGNNYFTSLDLSNNTALTDIYVGYATLTDLILPPGNTLTNVYCPGNQLTSLDISNNPNIMYLTCYDNQLSCIDLSNDTVLVNLDCSNNQLSGLNIKNGYNLNISFFLANNNPNLYCIQVDDVAYANGSWSFNIDPWTAFNTDCGIPTAMMSSSAPVCLGTPIVFHDLSFPTCSSWSWDFGDGTTSNVSDPLHTYQDPGYYNVTLIADDCYGSDTTSMLIMQNSDIHGHVDYSGGSVTNGSVVIYPYETYYTSFDTVDITGLDGSGNFFFPNVPQGDYLIKVFADSLAYPNLIPTYSYNQWAWDSAVVVLHGCVFNDTTNILMVELPAPTTGSGLLHGQVLEDIGFGRSPGEPVHGVDVKLGFTGTSTIVASTVTDTAGQYTFTGVANGNYTIYADIPGLERDSSYQITVDAINNQFLTLDYFVDSVKIDIIGEGIGIENIPSEISEFNVYPNPVRDNATIRYALSSDADVQLDIYNIYGVKVQSIVNTDQQIGEYYYNFNPKSQQLRSGVYFVSLTTNGKSTTMRIVVME